MNTCYSVHAQAPDYVPTCTILGLGYENLTEPYIGYVQINYKLKADLQCCIVGKGEEGRGRGEEEGRGRGEGGGGGRREGEGGGGGGWRGGAGEWDCVGGRGL